MRSTDGSRRLAHPLALLAGATFVAAGCHDSPTRNCSTATEINLIQLRGPEAEEKMQSVCERYPGGVRSALFVEETNLPEIHIPCLCAVTGFLLIEDNPELRSLEGLAEVEEIGGVIQITDNPSLESLVGLPAQVTLEEFHGISVEIARDHSLRDLSGLPSFNTAPGRVAVLDNDGLVSLQGLPGDLREVGGLAVRGNQKLSALSGLPDALTTVHGALEITLSTPVPDAWDLPRSLVRVDGDLVLGGFDSFLGMPEGLTAVGGGLTLLLNDGASNLEGLGAITTVGDNLTIMRNDMLADLTGLAEGLTVGGGVWVSRNAGLLDLAGLPEGLQVGFDEQSGMSLVVDGNASLVTLAGLPGGLVAVPGSVTVSRNPALADLSGLFDNLVTLGGGLYLLDNGGMVDLNGMAAVTSLGAGLGGESLYVEGNDALVALTGFPAGLTQLPGGIALVTNPALIDLSGLEDVESIGGDLVIGRRYVSDLGVPCAWSGAPAGNTGLTSLTGLLGLKTVEGTLAVTCNESLTALQSLSSLEEVGGGLALIGNQQLADISGLGGVGGVLTRVGGPFQVLCSPELDLQAVLDVIAEVVDVSAWIDLSCA